MTKVTAHKVALGTASLALFWGTAANADTATADFDISLTIDATCAVTADAASDIDLGTEDASATDLAGSSSFTVNCSKTTPYYIGLVPSNGDTGGAGVLSPSGASTDTVPYQLRQTAGTAGAIWGGTATTTAAGNGKAGTGNGADQTIDVFVTVPSADYAPDSYSDTVTITVNY